LDIKTKISSLLSKITGLMGPSAPQSRSKHTAYDPSSITQGACPHNMLLLCWSPKHFFENRRPPVSTPHSSEQATMKKMDFLFLELPILKHSWP
jgi:hypothetical protein